MCGGVRRHVNQSTMERAREALRDARRAKHFERRVSSPELRTLIERGKRVLVEAPVFDLVPPK